MFDKLGYIKNKNLVPGMIPMPGIITQAHDNHNRRITNLRQVCFSGKYLKKANKQTNKHPENKQRIKRKQTSVIVHYTQNRDRYPEYRELLNVYWKR